MISVIVTVFEQPVSLVALLYCLRAQTIDEQFEVLICDDGSSAETIRALSGDKDLLSLDIRYIWQCKRGYRASASKNNGIRCAKGDLLVFLDGDILVRPDFLSRHRAGHNTPGVIVCNPRRWVVGVEPSSLSEANAAHQIQESLTLLSKVAELAKGDMHSLFAVLERVCIDGEREDQIRSSRSKSSWLACVGFSFSIPAAEEIYFDERFEGWGPEDREFALRAVRKHGHKVVFRDDIEVFHLEICSTGRTSFSPLPKTNADITRYLRNMIYFSLRYPKEDLTPLMLALMEFSYNTAEKRWELATERRDEMSALSPGDLATKVMSIGEWLREHHLYPEVETGSFRLSAL